MEMLAEEQEIPWIDVEALFAGRAPEEVYLRGDPHWTPLGHRLVGEAVHEGEGLEGLGDDRPPVLLFAGLGAEARLDDAAATGVEALSLDWRTDLARAYARVGDAVVNVTPEYEECRRIARRQNLPLKEVMRAAAIAVEVFESR